MQQEKIAQVNLQPMLENLMHQKDDKLEYCIKTVCSNNQHVLQAVINELTRQNHVKDLNLQFLRNQIKRVTEERANEKEQMRGEFIEMKDQKDSEIRQLIAKNFEIKWNEKKNLDLKVQEVRKECAQELDIQRKANLELQNEMIDLGFLYQSKMDLLDGSSRRSAACERASSTEGSESSEPSPKKKRTLSSTLKKIEPENPRKVGKKSKA